MTRSPTSIAGAPTTRKAPATAPSPIGDQAIRLKQDYALAYYNRGNAYHAKGDYDSAIADYDQAIRLKPDDADAYNGRGLSYYRKGDYARAISDYDRALGIDPNHKLVAENKALAEKKLAKAKKKGWF